MVVAEETELLRAAGHEVELYLRHNDEVAGQGRFALAQQSLWSSRTTADIAKAVYSFKPDVIHVHNTLPLISPSVYWAAARAGVPVVQTLHNFRLMCPQAMLLREGRICEDCVGRTPWRGVTRRCYRGSAAQTAVVAGTVQMHRWLGTWREKVTLYVALNEFCRQKFIEGGLPAERIRVKPNFLHSPERPTAGPRQHFLFVGRLSQEKGVGVLAAAAEDLPPGHDLLVAGTGPQSHLLQGLPRVRMLGALGPAEVLTAMRSALALVVPSLWYENFPRTIVEAYASGLPVVASRIGALQALVHDGRTGRLFDTGDARDLGKQLAWCAAHEAEISDMGVAARALFEQELDADANLEQITAIYIEAIQHKAATR